MSAITVKNIPEDLYEKLKLSAKLHHRSINNEIIMCIEYTLMNKEHDPTELLAQARTVREKTSSYLLKDDELTKAKNTGRK